MTKKGVSLCLIVGSIAFLLFLFLYYFFQPFGDAKTTSVAEYLAGKCDVDYKIVKSYVRIAREQDYVEPRLLLAVAKVESSLDENAKNKCSGARGLTQVIPRWHMDKMVEVCGPDAKPSDLYDPEVSLLVAAMYLKELRKQTGSLRASLQAYNQGIGAWKQNKKVGMAYASKVMRIYNNLKRLKFSG